MPLITWADVVARYPAVETRGGATEIHSSYIFAVEARLNGYFAGFFTVPFSSNNLTAVDLAIDLTYSGVGNMKIADAKELRKEILERMEQIKLGNESMMLSDGTAMMSGVDGTIWSSTEDYTPVFGMSPEEFMQVDSSQVYNEEMDRGVY